MTGVDLSVIVTAHREGLLVGPALHSLRAAVAQAAAAGLTVEVIAVLDRADAVTEALIRHGLEQFDVGCCLLLPCDEGDPGQARNRGVAQATGRACAMIDADDLISDNWLTAAWQMSARHPQAIWHSACNMVFGAETALWWHVDSESPLFDADYLHWGNYWDAMSFAPAALYRCHPFRRNDLTLGHGHEDWHWNCVTLAAGHAHRPVPGTMHYKRRRPGSQMALVERSDGVPWPWEPGRS